MPTRQCRWAAVIHAQSPNPRLLSALGACTAITLRLYAARKQWPLDAVEAVLALDPDGKPCAGGDITRHITLHGPLDGGQRERLLQISNPCPLHTRLTGETGIASTLAH